MAGSVSLRARGSDHGKTAAAVTRRDVRVLLVEDEEAHAELVRRAFESRAGVMRLSVAPTLREARAELQESPPDLALIDLVLPDGTEVRDAFWWYPAPTPGYEAIAGAISALGDPCDTTAEAAAFSPTDIPVETLASDIDRLVLAHEGLVGAPILSLLAKYGLARKQNL